MSEVGASVFQLNLEGVAWASADTACRAKGGGLVEPLDKATMDSVAEMMAQGGVNNAWIGARTRTRGKVRTERG